MTIHLELAVLIDATTATVWQELKAIQRHVTWMRDAEQITFVSTDHEGLAAAFDCVTRVGPFRTTDRMRVSAWEPDRCLGIEHHGAVTGAGRFTLEPDGSAAQTRMTWTEVLTFPWWMGGRVGEVAARPILRRIWRSNLERFRQQFGTAPR